MKSTLSLIIGSYIITAKSEFQIHAFFQSKSIAIFLISPGNICCGYSLEVPHCGEIKKNISDLELILICFCNKSANTVNKY